MQVLGFGVYQVPAEQTEQVVSDALAAGYRSLAPSIPAADRWFVGKRKRARWAFQRPGTPSSRPV
jgi:2,5-diketo-D-gluconate reductase A